MNRLEGRAPGTLFESDFLLLVDDQLRVGALRFRTSPGGPFLAEPRPGRVPPLIELNRLLAASDRVTRREELDEDLRMLVGPGTSLGGARPKAAIRDRGGMLAIAKFPHARDDRDAGPGRATIRPDGRISSSFSLGDEHAGGRGRRAALLSRHRRRSPGSRRRAQKRSRRALEAGGIQCPGLDERPRVLTTHIDEHDDTASLELALGTAGYHGLGVRDAERIAGEVGSAVAVWREVAMRMGATRKEADRMESAFAHEDLEGALGLG